MERVCSLSSPDSSLSTSSFASNSLQSSPSVSPCKRPNRYRSFPQKKFRCFGLSLSVPLSSLRSMSEDDGHESGCDTVEGSPTSDTSTSPRGNSAYRYLNNNNRPALAAVVAPLPSPTEQGRSPRGIRTMIVPPMRVQSNNRNSRGSEERAQRTSQCTSLLFVVCCMKLHKVFRL